MSSAEFALSIISAKMDKLTRQESISTNHFSTAGLLAIKVPFKIAADGILNFCFIFTWKWRYPENGHIT